MATEIASAYVSLIPTFKGGKAAIAGELGAPLEQAGEEAGKKAGEKGSKGFGGAFAAGAKSLAGGLALFGGINLIKDAFDLSVQQASLPSMLKQQFGLVGPIAQESADAAGRLFAAGWGESLTQVGESVGVVGRALNELGDNGSVENVTRQAEALSKTFGEEVPSVVQAAAQLVRTGLAPDMAAAMDTIAAGFQSGVNSGQDFLDTIGEYSGQFQKLGLDGPMAIGLINQALAAGARNSDFVADAIKEFSIRAVDGSKTTAAGFKAIGLDATAAAAEIAKGGPAAETMFSRVLEGLRGIKDPVAQSQAAVALFGTKAEDLGKALFAMNPATAAAAGGMDNVAGAADRVAGNISGSLSTQLEQLSRTFKEGLASALTGVLPVLSAFMGFLQPMLPILAPIAIGIGVITAAQWLWNAAMAANPIGLVITLVAGLIVGFIALWNKSAAFRDFFIDIWEWIKNAVSAVVDWFPVAWSAVINFLTGLWQGFLDFLTWIWDTIKSLVRAYIDFWILVFTTAFEWFRSAWNSVVEFLAGIWAGIVSAVQAVIDWFRNAWDLAIMTLRLAWENFKGFFTGLWNGISSFVSGIWSGIVGAVTRAGNALMDVWNGFKAGINRIFQGIADFGSGIWGGIVGAAKSAINGVIRVVNGAIGGINSVTGVVGIPGIPKIPMLAKGGVVDRPTLAMIGEGNESEAVMPLSKLNTMLATAEGNGGGETAVYVYLDGEPVRAIARTEIRKDNRETARAVMQGTGKLR
ncbi:phage tail tape measure protein [Amycolatopsis sp. NPDC003731]